MKIPNGKQIPQTEAVQKPFIDRAMQRMRFWQEYDMHRGASSSWSVCVLDYYGMGGIGKSELANVLSNELSEKSIAHLFFTFSDDISFMENIIELRNCLVRTAHISFVHFDSAYVTYCGKSGRSLSELTQKSILNSKYMLVLSPILDILPSKRINLASAILKALAPLEKELGRTFREESFDFCLMSPDKIYERLQYYFMLDLADGIRQLQEPFPVILDNLDAKVITETMEFKRWFLSEKGLIQNIPNIVWALFSREKIPDADFPEKVLQYIPVEEFSYEDTKEYLKACGINPEYWLHIYSLTDGIPLYLYICIEDYYTQLKKKQEIQLSEIGAHKEELIHCFFKHLNIDQKKVLQLMAFLEIWGENVFMTFLAAMNVDETAYCEMKDKPFIKKFADKYHLHSVVVKAVREYTSPTYYKRLKNAYKDIMASLKVETDETILMETKMTLYELNSDDALVAYIFSLAGLFGRYVQELEFNYVYSLHSTICERLMHYPNKILARAMSYFYYGIILRKVGNCSDALVQLQIAYQYVCDVPKPANMNEYFYKHFVIQVKGEYAHLLDVEGRFDDALKLRQACWSEVRRLDGKKSFPAIACMQNLAKQYMGRKEYREIGIKMLTKIIKSREGLNLCDDYEKEQNERYKQYAKMDLANAYADMGEYEKAIEYGTSAIAEMTEKFGASDYDTRIHLENFANILMQLQAYDLVIELLEKIFIEWKQLMNDDSKVLQALKYKLGIAYGECKRFEEGKKLLRELYEYSYDTLGAFHKITLRNRKQYAIILAQEGNCSEAIEMLSDCLETYLNYYGMDGDIQLLHLFSSLITEYHKLHNEEMVEELQNKVLQADNWEDVPTAEMAMLDMLGIKFKHE